MTITSHTRMQCWIPENSSILKVAYDTIQYALFIAFLKADRSP